MKMIIFLMFLVILVNSCANKNPEIKYVEKPVYIECQKQKIPDKPEFIPYNAMRINFENKYYYCVDEDNAKIMIGNWLKYQNWCETIYELTK